MTEEHYAAQDELTEAAEQRSREARVTFEAALEQLKAERHPAYLAYEQTHPNDAARKSAFIARHVRDGYTRAEALDLWDREERRLSAAEARGGSLRLTARHANDDPDVAVPVD